MSNWLRKYAKKNETRCMNRAGYRNNAGTRRSMRRALNGLTNGMRVLCGGAPELERNVWRARRHAA